MALQKTKNDYVRDQIQEIHEQTQKYKELIKTNELEYRRKNRQLDELNDLSIDLKEDLKSINKGSTSHAFKY